MSVAQRMTTAASSPSVPQPRVLPTLFGEGYGTYRTRPSAFIFSFALNIFVTALVVWSGHWVVQHRQEIKEQVGGLVTDISPYVLQPSAKESGGGGGGGGRGKLEASKGSRPPQSRERLATRPRAARRESEGKVSGDGCVVDDCRPRWASSRYQGCTFGRDGPG